MKAVVREQYGPPEVLQLTEIPKPEVGEKEVLIKIRAATVTRGDTILRSGKFPGFMWLPGRLMFGFFRPRDIHAGWELAGVVESVGADANGFKAGDEVVSTSNGARLGGLGEYIAIPVDRKEGILAPKAKNLSFGEAAAGLVGALTANFFLQQARIERGQKALIAGASGSVGSYAVQLAGHLGAEVTGICGPSNVELVKSLGAERVIDYSKEDFSQSGEKYDVIFDTVGKTKFSALIGALSDSGCLLMTNFNLRRIAGMIWHSMVGKKRVISGVATEDSKDMLALNELFESGELKPVIDRHYPLDQIVEAHRYVEAGHKKGNVVIDISE